MALLGLLCVVTAFAFVFGLLGGWGGVIVFAVFSVCALVYGFFDDTPSDVG